uniref:F-box domain-containing protein n=1 Tax=Parastrongyloides trichosuri TaxID=131310 RepID=A0A0N4ZIA8_PARTI
MVFIGKDWRAPGDAWVRLPHTNNWELIRLRPTQIMSNDSNAIILSRSSDRLYRLSSSNSSLESSDESSNTSSPVPTAPIMISTDDTTSNSTGSYSSTISELNESWIPHCFVKGNSKEFVGCTSMSEAFYRLDLARAVVDVRRFNYVCKVVQILVTEKLKDLSATSRKHLLSIIQAIVIHCTESDCHVSTARDLVTRFGDCLEEPRHIIGSTQLISDQINKVECLMDILTDQQPMTLPESNEDSLTFLDLPKEIISVILRKLPDHISLIESSKAHEVFQDIVDGSERLWANLCSFHFSAEQIKQHRKSDKMPYRKLFYELKKFYGLKEHYADIIHICCHCKALFWKDHGHPCLSEDAPSVRVPPRQFVDMLLFL